MIWLLDIGNSRAKLCKMADGTIIEPIMTASLPALKDTLLQSGIGRNDVIVVAGTARQEIVAATAQVLQQASAEVVLLTRESPLPFLSNYAAGEAGIDRLANVAAARQLTGGSCVVVDAGTAITMEVIDADGVFLGGYIYPGLALQSEMLASGTAHLPHINPDHLPPSIGANTNDAISSGIIYGTAGALTRLLDSAHTLLSKADCPVILTGGAAPLLAQVWHPDNLQLQPNLTLLGLYHLALHQSPQSFKSQ